MALGGVGLAAAEAIALLARPRPPALGALSVTPSAARLSVRAGERVPFSAAADGALTFSWSLWGRPVSHEATWSYVPGPEDAGWQQVTVEVGGVDGTHLTHTWDVGVIAALVPELVEIAPPAGTITLPIGGEARFRCGARLPAARAEDRLHFEWRVDDAPALDEQRAAAGGTSELVIPLPELGTHRVLLRVSEDGQAAARAEWVLEVVPPAPTPEDAPAAREPPHVVRDPGPRVVDGVPGAPLVFTVRVEPGESRVAYRWTLDGRPVARNDTGQFTFLPWTPGRRRVAVRVLAGGREIGRDAWVVAVRERVPATPGTEAPDASVPDPDVDVSPGPDGRNLIEGEILGWLEEYARAWSRKDVAALRRMGQVRSDGEAAKLVRYFASVDELQVDVRVVSLRIDGTHASVELERTDVVTDPSGRRQELRMAPIRKDIERSATGLRFTDEADGE